MTSSEFTPHAFIALSNSGGIEIMINRSNDCVYYRFNYGQDNLQDEEIFESEILYSSSENEDADSEPYFIHGEDHGIEYFLHEAMRIH